MSAIKIILGMRVYLLLICHNINCKSWLIVSNIIRCSVEVMVFTCTNMALSLILNHSSVCHDVTNVCENRN